MNSKQMSKQELIKKIGTMINGMQKHMDQKSTVANMMILINNKIISRMTTSEYLRNGFVRMFVGDDAQVNTFAAHCLMLTIEERFRMSNNKDEVLGCLCDAMHMSRFGHEPEVQKLIHKLAPYGWMKPEHRKAVA